MVTTNKENGQTFSISKESGDQILRIIRQAERSNVKKLKIADIEVEFDTVPKTTENKKEIKDKVINTVEYPQVVEKSTEYETDLEKELAMIADPRVYERELIHNETEETLLHTTSKDF